MSLDLIAKPPPGILRERVTITEKRASCACVPGKVEGFAISSIVKPPPCHKEKK
jgi:hypothetical protein